jgi:hypothetical protein
LSNELDLIAIQVFLEVIPITKLSSFLDSIFSFKDTLITLYIRDSATWFNVHVVYPTSKNTWFSGSGNRKESAGAAVFFMESDAQHLKLF